MSAASPLVVAKPCTKDLKVKVSVNTQLYREEARRAKKCAMATGVIKLDSIAEAFEKAAKLSPHGSAALSTNSDRSSSGVSTASNSPTSSTSPVNNFSDSLPDGLSVPISYSNPVFELDPADYL
ncbi:hypothetical protein OSTOST_19948, partial [Ostertagia ostertagi]